MHTASWIMVLHVKKCKDSISYSQLRRLRRICTAEEDFDAKKKEMFSFFHQNNYPETVTDSALQRVKQRSQEDALLPVDRSQTNNRILFTLTYHPLNNRIKNIIFNNFRILQEDSHTKDIFDAPPLSGVARVNKVGGKGARGEFLEPRS